MSRVLRNVLALATVLVAGFSHGQESQCGPLTAQGQFGPFDYRTVSSENLQRVEFFHFTPDIAMASPARKDLPEQYDFVLRAFPNHSRALMNLVTIWERAGKAARLRGMRWPVECYFERAMRWRDDDPLVHLTYAIYLGKLGKRDDSFAELRKADELSAGANGNVLYNLGLAYFDRGDHEKALQFAHRAYALGFTLPGLKTKLTSVGKWREPTPADAGTAGSPPEKEAAVGAATAPERAR